MSVQQRRWASFQIKKKKIKYQLFWSPLQQEGPGNVKKKLNKAPFVPLRVLLCAMRARAHRWPLLFLRRPGQGRCEAEQWLRLGEAGGDWLHRRWGPPPALEPGQHSWPWRRHATPPPGPPLLPRCPGPWGQHLQRATLGVGRAADHPGAQRSGVGVRVGEPRAGLRIGWLFFIFFLILLFGCSFPFYFLFSRFFPSTPTLFWALLSYYREWRKKKVDSTNTNKPPTASTTMASASSSAQAAFGLGRRKKNPGLLDQIGKFFGGDKKRKGKVRKGGRGPNLSGPGGLLLCMLVIFADFTPRTTFFFSFLFFYFGLCDTFCKNFSQHAFVVLVLLSVKQSVALSGADRTRDSDFTRGVCLLLHSM